VRLRPGIYYWVATYTGDLASQNAGSASPCGSEILAVRVPTVSLQIAVRSKPGGTFRHARLACVGSLASGTGFVKAHAHALCRLAPKLAPFLASQPSDGLCEQTISGSETAIMRGKIGRNYVNRRFARRNSCEEADWRRARAFFAGGS
jgi:hypothetical protein